MIKTQVQIPDDLYREAKRVASEREISLAEVMRRGLEYIVRAYPPLQKDPRGWTPPTPRKLGGFRAPVSQWRELANDPLQGEQE
jgi:hypothetical protein